MLFYTKWCRCYLGYFVSDNVENEPELKSLPLALYKDEMDMKQVKSSVEKMNCLLKESRAMHGALQG